MKTVVKNRRPGMEINGKKVENSVEPVKNAAKRLCHNLHQAGGVLKLVSPQEAKLPAKFAVTFCIFLTKLVVSPYNKVSLRGANCCTRRFLSSGETFDFDRKRCCALERFF
ncbi:MAG TPA: hypothetical protein GX499_09980 [Clostridiales bacterium]|nr:hypothetical protein [Clostridiales bacterium]